MSKSCWDTRYNPFLAEFCKLDSLRSLLKTDVHLANCKKKLWQVIGEIVCDIAKKKRCIITKPRENSCAAWRWSTNLIDGFGKIELVTYFVVRWWYLACMRMCVVRSSNCGFDYCLAIMLPRNLCLWSFFFLVSDTSLYSV